MNAPRYREARERAGLSLGQAARWLRENGSPFFSKEHLDQIEQGIATPSQIELQRLSETYDVNLDWLLGGDGNVLTDQDTRGIEKLSPGDAAIVLDFMRSVRKRNDLPGCP